MQVDHEALQEQFDMLNEQQLDAVEHIDGPLLVVAGPGTGKTQLLSLRAANILMNRDVQPQNILCLTFTEAGAEAMRKRLVRLIGRDAYGIEIATFHGFAQNVRSRWPQHFSRNPLATLVTDLQQREILNGLLNRLPASSPIYSGRHDGVNALLGDAVSFIGRFKRSGLTTDEFRAINEQTIAFLQRVAEDDALQEILSSRVPNSASGKEAHCAAFEEAIVRLCSMATADMREPVISTPGIYTPYAKWLQGYVAATALIDEDGKASGYAAIRDGLFPKGPDGVRVPKDIKVAQRGIAMADIYDAYTRILEERNLYDFDDMILDMIRAVEDNPELQYQLQDRFAYSQLDEFQDTNGAQLKIVELLAGSNSEPNIMAVCDDDQAIMRFQGATIECIQQFQEKWHPYNIVLKTNYRSTEPIVELGKSIANQIETRLPASQEGKDISANRKDAVQTEFTETVCVSPQAEYYEVARDIRERIDSGFMEQCAKPDEAIAVISPKHQKLKELIPYLKHFNVPFSYTATSEVFEMESMQTLLAMLRYVAYTSMGRTERAEAQVPQIVAAPELGINPEQCIRFALHARKNHNWKWAAALSDAEQKPLPDLYAKLTELAGKAASMPVREMFFEISRPVSAYYAARSIEDPWAHAEFNAGVRALLDFTEAEIVAAGNQSRAVRLPEVVERMDELSRYGISIDGSISLGSQNAVRLTSAHSSKGLEFDRVYMLDADDSTWHNSRSGSNLFTQNMLVGDTKDEDDARRLLFVAITRAKSELELYRAGGEVVRELNGSVKVREEMPEAEEASQIIELGWMQNYALDTQELVELVAKNAVPSRLSVSAVNSFVDYEDGAVNSMSFPEKRLLRLPGMPESSKEFGTLVHSFFEEYVNSGTGTNAELLASKYIHQIEWLDYREEEVTSLVDRFKRIVSTFIPWLDANLEGRPVTEAKIESMTEDGVPLIGYCDLLLVDDDAKTVKVIDYKTGLTYQDGKPSPGYERQLKFYKLLIESSPEYQGYTVTECMDVFVEPERGTDGTLHEPVGFPMKEADPDRLRKLISVVWRRINEGDFDTSAFEESEHKARAVAANVKKDGTPKARMDRRLMQSAYEDWLIEQG